MSEEWKNDMHLSFFIGMWDQALRGGTKPAEAAGIGENIE